LFTYINKILLNICAKVYLDPLIRLKVIYLKLWQNMIILLHEPNYLFYFCAGFNFR